MLNLSEQNSILSIFLNKKINLATFEWKGGRKGGGRGGGQLQGGGGGGSGIACRTLENTLSRKYSINK